MNPLRSLAPRLTATLAVAVVAGASLFASPQAAMAQRVQDAPSAAAGTHQSAAGAPVLAPAAVTATGAAAAATGAAATNPKAKEPAPRKLSPAELQQEIKLEQAMAAQQAAGLAGTSVAPKTPFQQRFPWATHIFATIFLISAVGLVLLLAFQTTKQEGLSGTIGGRVEAAYRPRLGFDQQLQRITSVAAITMVIFATIVSLTGI